MVKKFDGKFTWVIENFSSLQSKKIYSDSFVIGGCRWRLVAYPRENDNNYLSMYLVSDDMSWYAAYKVRGNERFVTSMENQVGMKFVSVIQNFSFMNTEKCYSDPFAIRGFKWRLLAECDLLFLHLYMCINDCPPFPSAAIKVRLTIVQSVRLIFERHPETAVGFRAKNQYLRTTFMNFLLSLIQTLYQPLQELSSEDLVEADIALTYLRDVGFKVDWLENKLDQLKARKEKERACEARVQEMEAQLHDLKHKFEIEKAELSVTRAPLSFNDFV
ncbi:TRAF-like family protein [Raphanus sativus]|nr:TRAF-like family protein [Raphanus sativus]